MFKTKDNGAGIGMVPSYLNANHFERILLKDIRDSYADSVKAYEEFRDLVAAKKATSGDHAKMIFRIAMEEQYRYDLVSAYPSPPSSVRGILTETKQRDRFKEVFGMTLKEFQDANP